MIVAWLLLACVDDGPVPVCQGSGSSTEPPSLVGDPLLHAPSPDTTPLAFRFELTATGPVCLAVVVDDGSVSWTVETNTALTEHSLPVLGLHPGRAVTATWTATDTGDEVVGAGTRTAETPPLPERFPDLTLLAHDPGRRGPGHVLLDLKVPNTQVDAGEVDEEEPAYLVVLDEDLEVVWFLVAPVKIGAVTLTPNQQLIGLSGGNAVIWDWYGTELQTWRSNADATSPIAVDARDFHHEVLPLDDGGLWTLSFDLVTVPAYPESYDDPTLLGPEAVLDDPIVLHVAADGSLVSRWAISERLDTERIGYDSLDRLNKERWDWAHANALVLDPSDGGVLVSLRHQDAIVKLSASGELVWILASPTGWQPQYLPFLLVPEGDVAWPYHQHRPRLTDDGTLLVFDNGPRGHNPYEAEGAEAVDRSRVVAYTIDAEAGTVRQDWSYEETLTGELYASALSGVDPVPGTDHVLASYGFLTAEGGIDNSDAGLGVKSVRLIQLDPAALDDPVFDLRLGSQADHEPAGWKSYRAEPIPPLQTLRPG